MSLKVIRFFFFKFEQYQTETNKQRNNKSEHIFSFKLQRLMMRKYHHGILSGYHFIAQEGSEKQDDFGKSTWTNYEPLVTT